MDSDTVYYNQFLINMPSCPELLHTGTISVEEISGASFYMPNTLLVAKVTTSRH